MPGLPAQREVPCRVGCRDRLHQQRAGPGEFQRPRINRRLNLSYRQPSGESMTSAQVRRGDRSGPRGRVKSDRLEAPARSAFEF